MQTNNQSGHPEDKRFRMIMLHTILFTPQC